MKQTLDDQKSIQAKESMKTEDYFFNIHDLRRGIQRELTEGVSTCYLWFPLNPMPGARSIVTPKNNGVFCWKETVSGFRTELSILSRQGTSGRLQAALTTGLSADQKALKSWIFSAHPGKNTVSPGKDILPQIKFRQST